MTELVSENSNFKIIDTFDNVYNNNNKYVTYNSIEKNEKLTMVKNTNYFDIFSTKTPIFKYADFNINEGEDYFIIDNNAGATRITFPNPETSKGRGIIIKNIQNQDVLSTESIVQYEPVILSNKILSFDKPYKQAYLESNGMRWIVKYVT